LWATPSELALPPMVLIYLQYVHVQYFHFEGKGYADKRLVDNIQYGRCGECMDVNVDVANEIIEKFHRGGVFSN
jgi:hypothetical protein